MAAIAISIADDENWKTGFIPCNSQRLD